MNTKGHCYPKSIILQAVYFKLRLALSYRDVEGKMKIRGVIVDYTAIQRWVYKFTSFIEAIFSSSSFQSFLCRTPTKGFHCYRV